MKSLCYYGNPILRKKCRKVKEITPFVRKVVAEMIEAVKTHNGAGLAAPQIGYNLCIFVNVFSKDIDEKGFPLALDDPEVYINPNITRFSRKKFTEAEGCLSIPGVTFEITRANEVDIEYMGLDGVKRVSLKEKEWRAKCLQHELDHLNGVLFIDYLSKKDIKDIQPTLFSLEKRFIEDQHSSCDLS